VCRHLAYVGQPRTLQELILDPPHSLARQAYAPRLQNHGVVNADGFGAGWYVPGRRTPVRYRRAQPIWSDASFASLAPTIASTCVLAAVRSATPGFSTDESGAAPFVHGTWLFSHNGRLEDWPRARKALWERTFEVPDAAAPVDSALLFGLAASKWSAGSRLGDALAEVIHEVCQVGGGRLTMLATDGRQIAGTTYGERLFYLEADTGIIVASEPHDDASGWREVPAEALVEAGEQGVTVSPLGKGMR
jgi:glutamine amidotransferase